jgi:SPP1 gp7 family putative phage head morphogenesis protein
MSANQQIEDGLTRHHILVQRYAKGRESEASRYMGRLVDDVISRVKRDNITELSKARMGMFLLDMGDYVRLVNSEYSDDIMSKLTDFANNEAEVVGAIVQNATSAVVALPSANQLESAIFTNIMDLEPSKGYTVQSILAEFGDNKARQIEQYIRDGFAMGETTDQIASRISKNTEMLKGQARALARTVTNHTAIQSRNTTMKENSDILDGYEWVATLDGRTSVICGSRDGVVYSMDDSNPKPPAHFNCRSTITYVVKPEFNLGGDIDVKRPSKGADGIKSVKQGTSYSTWLKRQPAAFQDEILGSARGKLFRRGKVKLENFVDKKGNELTLEQLKALESTLGTLPKPSKRNPVKIMPKPKPEPKKKMLDSGFFDGNIVSSRFTSRQYVNALAPNLSDTTLQVVRKAPIPTMRVDGSRGYYQPSSARLVAGQVDKSKMVLIHEYGHHIDFILNKDNALTGFSSVPFSHIDTKFKKAIKADSAALFPDSKTTSDFLTKYKSEHFEKYKKRANSRYTYTRPKLHKTDGDFENGITDIFDAMTGGVAHEQHRLPGHGYNYFRSQQNVATEIFANVFAMYNGDSETKRRARKLFPNLFGRMDEILKDYIDGKI